jgi:hypothetical protein
VQPAQVLAADLTGEPAAELFAELGHRGPAQRAGLLQAHLAAALAQYFKGIEMGGQQQRHVHRGDDVGKAKVSNVVNKHGPHDRGQNQVDCRRY